MRTSSATTAKPRPASPARAASMAALRARRLVWSAIWPMLPTKERICSARSASSWTLFSESRVVRATSRTCRTTWRTAVMPSSAAPWARETWEATSVLRSAVDWAPAATSCTEALICSVPAARLSICAAVSPTPARTSCTEAEVSWAMAEKLSACSDTWAWRVYTVERASWHRASRPLRDRLMADSSSRPDSSARWVRSRASAARSRDSMVRFTGPAMELAMAIPTSRARAAAARVTTRAVVEAAARRASRAFSWASMSLVVWVTASSITALKTLDWATMLFRPSRIMETLAPPWMRSATSETRGSQAEKAWLHRERSLRPSGVFSRTLAKALLDSVIFPASSKAVAEYSAILLGSSAFMPR